MPPYSMHTPSEPQMPHTLIFKSTSFGPASGLGISIHEIKPGAVTWTDFLSFSEFGLEWDTSRAASTVEIIIF